MAYMRATHRCSGTKVECDQLVIHRRILFLDEKSSMNLTKSRVLDRKQVSPSGELLETASYAQHIGDQK